jgi:hypothetical protein
MAERISPSNIGAPEFVIFLDWIVSSQSLAVR